ncbi:ChbG/HpnK family deacetylase [Thiotrichales bacterium 19S11-10]|nr:ChbG/HpnK family deacetylase [Thiotrichales bacterium 19S11-10]
MVTESFKQTNQKYQTNRKIILCADDFGYDDAISHGIKELLELKRINATSSLTNFDEFKQHAKLINSIDGIYKGIHFNLTEGQSLIKNKNFQPLGHLLLRTHTHLVNYQYIYHELKAQLDCYIDTFKQLPDFIDGHQHIHHLPIIRHVVFKLYNQYQLKQKGVFIRSVYHQVNPPNFKSLIIKHTGANAFDKKLKKLQIPHNQSFGGIYNFKADEFEKSFTDSLKKITDNGLIMCHPGYFSENDTLNQTREVELNYLKSDKFSALLKQENIELKVKS